MCMLTIIQRERRDYIQGMGNESVNTCTAPPRSLSKRSLTRVIEIHIDCRVPTHLQVLKKGSCTAHCQHRISSVRSSVAMTDVGARKPQGVALPLKCPVQNLETVVGAMHRMIT